MRKRLIKKIVFIWVMAFAINLFMGMNCIAAAAEDGGIQVVGRVYQFDEKNGYEFSSSNDSVLTSDDIQTYGTFSIKGDVIDTGTKDSFAAYTIGNGDVTFSYTYSDILLNAAADERHIVKDDNKEIDSIKLGKKVGKGTLIVLTSQDGENWVEDTVATNVFEENPTETEPFYTTKGVQLTNGCYYRVIVAYKTGKQVQAGQAFPPKLEKYEYKKYAEVYDFYLGNEKAVSADNNTLKFNLGDNVINTGKDNGFNENEGNDLDVQDPHYGWKLGSFFVSGYTSETENNSGDPVFLKNVGDKVSLYYNLIQDITKLNGEDTLSVAEDDNGYDMQFNIGKTNFGHGTLIVQYTDYENVKHDPVIYTNFLEANAKPSADTVIDLFEEGDYEVALDYEIKNDKHVVLGKSILPEYTDYRTHFKFSVRNGNCMVFPFDVSTGQELTNTSITENGFRLDLAKSRYLTIIIKKEVLVDGANGLTEDTRFNRPAKDGDEYTEEGIYTITVSNQYTKQETQKIIYVGTNPVLKAVVLNGLSYEDVQELVKNGATINEDGTIVRQMKEETSSEKSDTKGIEPSGEENADAKEDSNSLFTMPIIPVVGGIVAVLIIVGIIAAKKKKAKSSKKHSNGGEY